MYTHADLTGVSLRGGWLDFQPAEETYRWPFDAEIARAGKAGKRVMLSIDPGTNIPAWVYQAGAKPFVFRDENPYRRTQGQNLQIPVPWDRVFLEKWKSFIQVNYDYWKK